ncbi:MAG TPA: GNAT family N-acetyltransferase [Pyrinomonadaceae bacterium]|nr:GNAT family N-acetyltransferase [Pyrinomonadaceae bacterium]
METANLMFRPLRVEDASALSEWLRAQPPAYARFFHPFGYDEPAIADALARQGRDVFMGLFWREGIVGFFMLRGWNEGYEVPAFGILIDEQYRGHGLEMAALDTAKVICRLRNVSRLMIKMHPDNISAKGVARKTGFVQTGVEAASGNLIYHYEIKPRIGLSTE